jgi:hypothetical protein
VIEAEEPSENSRSRIAYGGGGRIRSRDGEIKGRKGVWVVGKILENLESWREG